jgi:hypothetical protein
MADDHILHQLIDARETARNLAREHDPKTALDFLDGAVGAYAERRRQAVPPPPPPPGRVADRAPRSPRPRPRELAKRRLFDLAKPALMLTPVNIIEIYFRDHPMWPSWAWDDTREADTRMLPFVQALDPDEPLPEDARLAQPMTAAGTTLRRALHVKPGPSVVTDVYDELGNGILLLDELLIEATRRAHDHEVPAEFLEHFADATVTAERLLFHAARVGLDAWLAEPPLIRQCVLGPACPLGEPFFVNRPGEDRHSGCRVKASRSKPVA